MKIGSSFCDNNSKRRTSFKGVPTDYVKIPEAVGKLGKIANEYIHSPEQRLFLGLSTLCIRPILDMKYADEDKTSTRKEF